MHADIRYRAHHLRFAFAHRLQGWSSRSWSQRTCYCQHDAFSGVAIYALPSNHGRNRRHADAWGPKATLRCRGCHRGRPRRGPRRHATRALATSDRGRDQSGFVGPPAGVAAARLAGSRQPCRVVRVGRVFWEAVTRRTADGDQWMNQHRPPCLWVTAVGGQETSANVGVRVWCSPSGVPRDGAPRLGMLTSQVEFVSNLTWRAGYTCIVDYTSLRSKTKATRPTTRSVSPANVRFMPRSTQ
jgi:hypothetical protein